MFIGHIPDVGNQALAGAGVTTPVILAISAFAALVSMGGAPKASIFLGREQIEQAEKVLGSCTWMLILLSLVLTGIMFFCGKPILLLDAILINGFGMGVQVACQYSFVALDQAPKAIFLTVWRKIILLIPLIFILPHVWPNAVTGVYLAEPIADTI